MAKVKLFEDDKGNTSTMRVALGVFLSLITVCIVILFIVVLIEATKETPDYSGLAQLVGALLGGGVISLFAKAWQKKFEK